MGEIQGAAPRQFGMAGRAAGWLLRRLAGSAVIMLLVTLVVFLAFKAMPEDPAQIMLGQMARPEAIATLREELGLNRPLAVQYVDWLAGLLRGDMGLSWGATRQPVADLVGAALANSMVLVVLSSLISVPLAVALGVYTALHRNSALDHVLDYLLLGLSSIPEFAKGILLVLLLSVGLFHLLPATAMIPPGASPLRYPDQIALPVLVLVISGLPYLTRLVRSSMIDALNAEHVHMARLKGLAEPRIVLRHALPNISGPLVQGTALSLALSLGGAVVIEYLFRYPGLGALMTDAISSRNLPLIQGAILAFAVVYMVINLIADILILRANPQFWRAG